MFYGFFHFLSCPTAPVPSEFSLPFTWSAICRFSGSLPWVNVAKSVTPSLDLATSKTLLDMYSFSKKAPSNKSNDFLFKPKLLFVEDNGSGLIWLWLSGLNHWSSCLSSDLSIHDTFSSTFYETTNMKKFLTNRGRFSSLWSGVRCHSVHEQLWTY